jgi:hypothetical protein
MHIDDGTGEKKIHRVDVTGIMLVSDSPPNPEDSMVGDSV